MLYIFLLHIFFIIYMYRFTMILFIYYTFTCALQIPHHSGFTKYLTLMKNPVLHIMSRVTFQDLQVILNVHTCTFPPMWNYLDFLIHLIINWGQIYFGRKIEQVTPCFWHVLYLDIQKLLLWQQIAVTTFFSFSHLSNSSSGPDWTLWWASFGPRPYFWHHCNTGINSTALQSNLFGPI